MFERVISHLMQLAERVHENNARMGKDKDEAAKHQAIADEYKAAAQCLEERDKQMRKELIKLRKSGL